jgi:hypothetical protein
MRAVARPTAAGCALIGHAMAAGSVTPGVHTF